MGIERTSGIAKKPRSRFTLQFKLDMVNRIARREQTIADIARETGLHPSLLGTWSRDRTRIEELHTDYKYPQSQYQSKLGFLKRELRRVIAERNILKKAKSYFAKHG